MRVSPTAIFVSISPKSFFDLLKSLVCFAGNGCDFFQNSYQLFPIPTLMHRDPTYSEKTGSCNSRNPKGVA